MAARALYTVMQTPAPTAPAAQAERPSRTTLGPMELARYRAGLSKKEGSTEAGIAWFLSED